MNRPTDCLLTLLLLAPCLVAGVVAAVLLRPAPRSWRSRRLTDEEVRALYRITSERARQGQWN
ncbi:hypothetical protein V5E97_10270 [Singulisphaera sp. Ch08]|uniref:Uncharacterized protein n=1 Tax=Singulisphaera sp. Ch08 TaxID=3120278 RepID=A0AAU7CN22_9BACT